MKISPVAPLVVGFLERKAQGPSRLGVRAWDGSVAGPSDGPVVVLRSPRALVRFFYRPGQLGWARAFVAGEVDVEGDLSMFLRHAMEMFPADVENLRAHFAPTMRAWQANLERHWDSACSLIGAGRARAWRVYFAGAALMLDAGLIGINHLLLIRPHTEGPGPLAPRRTAGVAARPSYAEGPLRWQAHDPAPSSSDGGSS